MKEAIALRKRALQSAKRTDRIVKAMQARACVRQADSELEMQERVEDEALDRARNTR